MAKKKNKCMLYSKYFKKRYLHAEFHVMDMENYLEFV